MTPRILCLWFCTLALVSFAACLWGFDLAFALGGEPPRAPRAAPAPLIGLGAPIVGAVVVTLYLARFFRR